MIFLLHGDDTFRSREKLRELREKFLRDVDPSGANLMVLDGAHATAGDVWAAISAQSFLVRRRMVVVEGMCAAPQGEQAAVAVFLPRIPEDAVVVFWESGIRHAESGRRRATVKPPRSDGRTRKTGLTKSAGSDALLPALLEHADHAQAFAPLEGTALAAWVREHAQSLGVEIERGAADLLVVEVGSDLWRMHAELGKLAAAALGNRATSITPDLIRAHVAVSPTEDVFAFTDAVGRGDRATALRLLRDLMDAGTDAFQLVGLLGRQLRLLLAARDLLDRGTLPSRLAAELAVPPFVATKIGQQARRLSLHGLRALHGELVNLDQRLKFSRCPREVLLALFALDATASTPPGREAKPTL